jgi:hypothetical protein
VDFLAWDKETPEKSVADSLFFSCSFLKEGMKEINNLKRKTNVYEIAMLFVFVCPISNFKPLHRFSWNFIRTLRH